MFYATRPWSLEATWCQISKAFLISEGIWSLSSTAEPYSNHHHLTLRRTNTMRWIMAKIITLEGREVHLMKGSSLYWSSFTNYSRQTSQGLTSQGITQVFLALLSWKVLAHVKFLILRNWKLTSNQFLRGGKITFLCLNTLMINYHSTLCVLAFLLHTYCKC